MPVNCQIVPDGTGESPAAFDFEVLPREGEFIHVFYQGDLRRFRVLRVEHKSVTAQSSGPAAEIHVTDATS